VAFIVHIQRFQQAFDAGELILDVENLKSLRQPGLAPVRPQKAVAQTVKSADPHAPHWNGQLRRQPRHHFLRRLVGEGHGQNASGRDLPGGNQPGNARGEHPRFAASGSGEDQGIFSRQGDSGVLLGIELLDEGRHCGILGARQAPGVHEAMCIGLE